MPASTATPQALRSQLQTLILAFPSTDPGQRFLALSGFSGIRPVSPADLASLDPYNDVTRRGVGAKTGAGAGPASAASR
jgi:ABC-type phosphate/phosphonate transport system substrate-binding protein